MPSPRGGEGKDSLHLRVDADVVRGVDALAVAWGVSRNEAANRLLDEGVANHIDDVVNAMEELIRRYQEGRLEPPDAPVDDRVVHQERSAG